MGESLEVQPASSAFLQLLLLLWRFTVKLRTLLSALRLLRCDAGLDEFGPSANLRRRRNIPFGISDLMLLQNFSKTQSLIILGGMNYKASFNEKIAVISGGYALGKYLVV